MTYKLIRLLALCSVLLIAEGCGKNSSGSSKKTKFVSIGTGGVTGVYYPTGGAICKMLNDKNKKYGIKATVESTGGSVYNINAIMNDDLDFGIAQSDRQYQAYKGLRQWKDKGKQSDLRSVFSIYPESITLLATQQSGVKNVKDLKGKRANLGNIGSGTLQNALDALKTNGLSEKDLRAEHIKPVESPGLVQDERIDAFFFTVGHPNGNIKEATSGRIKMGIVPISGPGVNAMLAKLPYYAKSVIPKEFYPNSTNKGDVETIGVTATLVTSQKVDRDIVYALTKEVFTNFEDFKKLHPAYKTITKESMLKGLSAPIHKGAMKYYKEAGLDKFIAPALMKGN